MTEVAKVASNLEDKAPELIDVVPLPYVNTVIGCCKYPWNNVEREEE
jgi:hypothetical protein